jgi:5'-3' exoribonuclease 2
MCVDFQYVQLKYFRQFFQITFKGIMN